MFTRHIHFALWLSQFCVNVADVYGKSNFIKISYTEIRKSWFSSKNHITLYSLYMCELKSKF